MMEALKQEIQRHMNDEITANVLLQCVLTIQGSEDSPEVIWQLVRSSREAVVSMHLHRGGGRLPIPREISEARVDFDRLVHTDSWSLADPSARSDLQ